MKCMGIIHARALWTAAVLAAVSAAAAACPASAQDIGDAGKGLVYAQLHCAECHAITPDSDRSPLGRAPAFRQVATTPGMTRTALTVWFRTPHPSMPNLIIPPSDQDDLITYILSLAGKR